MIWEIQFKGESRPVTHDMVMGALTDSISLVCSHMEDNKKLENDTQLRERYEQDALVLELLRDQLDTAVQQEQRSATQAKIPGRKNH
jgi:hypothetical protein